MARIGVPTESLKGMPPLKPGIYEVRLDKFDPKPSKKPGSNSVNLRPVMKVVNDPNGNNDREIYSNLNSGYPPEMLDLTHAFGQKMIEETGADGVAQSFMPGEFVPPDEPDPTKWTYMGPLLGSVGKVELAEADNGKGGKTIKVKRYFCNLPGCQEKHKESLL